MMTREVLAAMTAVTLAMAIGLPTHTNGEEMRVAVHGAGAYSCARFVQVSDAYSPFANGSDGSQAAWQASSAYWQFEQWIDGYIFGVDVKNSRPARNWDRAGMQLWMYSYCQKQPQELIANAARAFYATLSGRPQ